MTNKSEFSKAETKILEQSTKEAQCQIEQWTFRLAGLQLQQWEVQIQQWNFDKARYYLSESIKLLESVKGECISETSRKTKDSRVLEIKALIQKIDDFGKRLTGKERPTN